MAILPNQLAVKDSSNNNKTLAAVADINGNLSTGHVAVDNTGNYLALALDGTDATGITPPAGGIGLRGWLSGIYSLLQGNVKTVAQASNAFMGKIGIQVGGNDVSTTNNFPVSDINKVPVTGRIGLTPGSAGQAGRSFAVICTVAGNVSVTFPDSSTGIYPVGVGLNVFPFAVTTVNTTGTTATATYENWK